MNEENADLDIRFIIQVTAISIQPEELTLIESIMPDLILTMMQENDLDND